MKFSYEKKHLIAEVKIDVGVLLGHFRLKLLVQKTVKEKAGKNSWYILMTTAVKCYTDDALEEEEKLSTGKKQIGRRSGKILMSPPGTQILKTWKFSIGSVITQHREWIKSIKRVKTWEMDDLQRNGWSFFIQSFFHKMQNVGLNI